ncbi:MAG: hypothetical protein UMU04_04075, partial [Halanaerobiales bacterium]|nr:hypothetical protein [Halanaerobiales bacterium]
MITKSEYFNELGFIRDPFASTNALHEDMLKDYFVYPDYFYSLLGSFEKPKSSIVLAPRGTGKTAQRKMIEYLSEEKNELISIIYDSFPIEDMNDVRNVTFEKHVNKIIEFLLIALLTKLDKENKSDILDENEKKKLIKLINNYFSGINNNEIDIAINSIKGFGDKLYDFWLKAGNSITSIINAILTKNGIGNVDFTSNTKKNKEIKNSKLVNILDFIEKIFGDLGVEAIYVLIDRVDENRLTNNDSNKSYRLIKPIISDLPLLERENIVFKFFLWDKIQEHWHDDIRTDRIEIYNMKWQLEKIKKLISERLKAFSNGKINKLKQILNVDDYYINKIFQFSNNSPRDLINI